VTDGQYVKKGESLGQTGFTGIAGGDHLHFAMLVHGVFVNPVEWWDKNWIRTHILANMGI
jgi:murein DD-endopeptidase MepM/ murein hydrolase activator NlpD